MRALQRVAWAAAARVAAALGPVLQMCAFVPHTGQVDVARMLLLVVGEAARDPAAWAGAGGWCAWSGLCVCMCVCALCRCAGTRLD